MLFPSLALLFVSVKFAVGTTVEFELVFEFVCKIVVTAEVGVAEFDVDATAVIELEIYK